MPQINYEILSWARETAGLTLASAAGKLQMLDSKKLTAQEKLLSYENGKVQPSRAMLLKMAKVYRRPLLIFYLDAPPKVGNRGQDFRTLPDSVKDEYSGYVDALIRDVQARQSMIKEAMIDEDENISLDFVGRCNLDQSVEEVALFLKEVLGVNISEYRKKPNHPEAFKFLRKKAEEAGFFVLLKGNLGSHHTNIGLDVFRGFALSDDIAPFVVINDRDAKSAWAFTLLHEIVHILLGQTGVSGFYAEKKIEKFCNDVASEFLISSDEMDTVSVSGLSEEDAIQSISDIAFSKKISSSHLAYRLYRKQDVNKKQWEYFRDFYRDQWKAKREKEKQQSRNQKGGPNYYVVQKYKLGGLVDFVKRFNYSGTLSTTKAGILLDVKPLKVHRLFETGQIT